MAIALCYVTKQSAYKVKYKENKAGQTGSEREKEQQNGNKQQANSPMNRVNEQKIYMSKQASKQTTQKSLKKIAISIFNGKCADKNKFFFIYSRASRELASLLGKMTAIRCKKAKKINLTTR